MTQDSWSLLTKLVDFRQWLFFFRGTRVWLEYLASVCCLRVFVFYVSVLRVLCVNHSVYRQWGLLWTFSCVCVYCVSDFTPVKIRHEVGAHHGAFPGRITFSRELLLSLRSTTDSVVPVNIPPELRRPNAKFTRRKKGWEKRWSKTQEYGSQRPP